MSTHKHIDRICVMAMVLALLLAMVFMNGQALGIQAQAHTLGYEGRLFDTSKVHTIDIQIGDWEGFLETCQSEEYSLCDVVIDGESFPNVGIRGKGNTSLSTVSSMDSDRYSFKIEFDQYNSTYNYYGLDKLSLNNLIQDNTMMKDYLVYQMMGAFGVAAPLCSYVYITVNGEAWGLYLAVESVEESFLQRNYGTDYGELYKPDSMSMGGGRGNGRNFNMDDLSAEMENLFSGDSMPHRPSMPTDHQMDGNAARPQLPTDFDPSSMEGMNKNFGGMGDGMGTSDVKLQYIDDDPASYSNIFSSAKTDVTDADQKRLIQSLKILSSGENVTSAVDVEAVIRYFVVHNFVVNGDSYTGSMVHNYYLYEQDGLLSMIPWDYNLAFGTFQGSSATSAVNDDIDGPLSISGSGDRPMAEWIHASGEYTQLYHQYFAQFLNAVDIQGIIDAAAELIAPYVEQDPTKFCTYEEFEKGVTTLKEFCSLRTESVRSQLNGEVGDVDASSITLSHMGTMNRGNMGGDWVLAAGDMSSQFPGGMQVSGETGSQQTPEQGGASEAGDTAGGAVGSSQQFPDGMSMPEDMEEMTSGRDNVNFSGMAEMDSVPGTSMAGDNLVLLGVSVLILLISLLIVFKYKR